MNRNLSNKILVIILFIFFLTLGVFGQKEIEKGIQSEVEFKVISQRRLSKEEQQGSLTFNSIVRVRLTNNSKQHIRFVVFNTGENTYIAPLGFYYFRKTGEKDWQRFSPNDKFEGIRYKNLTLLPNMSIEYNIASASFENFERRYSIYLIDGNNDERFEVFSDVIQPIADEK